MIVIHFMAEGLADDAIHVWKPLHPQAYELLFDRMLKLWTEKEKGYRLKAGELLFRILHMASTEEAAQQSSSFLHEKAAETIRQKAFNADFSLADLAPALGVSGPYLRKVFKAAYQLTPKEFLTKIRMDYARSLLATGYFTIKEIAVRCGFENEKYFSTVFKAYYGAAPSAFLN
jgi:AraC-like DNA-binding protein